MKKKIETYIYFLFIVFLIIESFGLFYRYSILEQLGLSINLLNHESLYPHTESLKYYPGALYFPGLSLIIYTARFLIPDFFLMEFILILAILSIFFFFLISKKIAEETFNKQIKFENYWLIVILLCLWPCRYWLWYAAQFKPDILAFGLVFFSIYLLKPYNNNYKINNNYLLLFLSLIILVFAISLKQQAIFIVLALFFYSALNKNLNFKIYSFLAIFFIFLIYFYFYNYENLWFFNVERFSEHRLFYLNELIKVNSDFIIRISLFLIFLIGCFYQKLFLKNFNQKLKLLIKNLKKNFWIYATLFFSMTGLISGLKKGGNSANFELSIIVMTVFIFYFLSDLKKNIIIFAILGLLLLEIPNTYVSIKHYIDSKKLQISVKKNIKNKNLNILTDDRNMFATFLVSEDNNIYSIDTMKDLHISKDKLDLDTFFLDKNKLSFYDYLIMYNEQNQYLELEGFELIDTKFFGNIYKRS